VLEALATTSFLEDWCYPSPRLPDKKEICDLLVVFDRVAIIWQVKNLTLRKDGRYHPAEVEKNLRQLEGARRTLFDLSKPITLANPRRGPELFDPSKIQEVFLISLLAGEGEEIFSPLVEAKNRPVHVFTSTFADIVLNELDTISDFVAYLRAKEALLGALPKLVVEGGEQELLALYLFNERGFDNFQGLTMAVVEEGHWEKLKQRSEYIAKQRANEPSYLWDLMINRAHESGNPRYELIAREMARLTRFERRYLAKGFLEGHRLANDDLANNVFRRTVPFNGRTYCFLYAGTPPKPEEREGDFRRLNLQLQCVTARVKFPDEKLVIGIATEKRIADHSSFDFCLLDNPAPTPEEIEEVAALQRDTGIFSNITLTRLHEVEYPREKKEEKPE